MFFMQGQLTSLNEGSAQEKETKEDESVLEPLITDQERNTSVVKSVMTH